MFDLDQFVEECRAAVAESEPRLAVKQVLERAFRHPGAVTEALDPERAGITPLWNSPELTVINVVWAPGQRIQPHDHRMWAAIGIYAGQEDNAFYRRDEGGRGLVESGGKQLRTSDVMLLGDDTIHGVANPRQAHTGAIHVYGGDFFRQPRSEWDPETFEEKPYDMAGILAQFEAQNRQ